MKIAKYSMLLLLSVINCASTLGAAQAEKNSAAGKTSASSEISANISAEKTQNKLLPPPAAISPEALVKDLYAVHAADMKGQDDRIFNDKNRSYLDKYFDKNLADLIWKELITPTDEIGVLDFDPFYNAQDMKIRKLIVGQAKVKGAKATVIVNFTNFSKKETITYLLSQQNGAWKIFDIKYRDGDTLLGYFREDAKLKKAAANSGNDGNFEGTYQVGDTTVTVKPIKMAFELKWAKGTGTMMFFYTGKGVLEYSAEDKGKGADKFVFDDSNFKTGKFIRADGREMPVKKIN